MSTTSITASPPACWFTANALGTVFSFSLQLIPLKGVKTLQGKGTRGVIRLLIHMHMEVNHLEKTLVAFPTPCSLLTKKNKEKGFLSPPSYNGMLAKLYKLLWEAKGHAREPLNKDLQMDSHVTKRCSPKETFLSGLIIFKFCNTFVFISLC